MGANRDSGRIVSDQQRYFCESAEAEPEALTSEDLPQTEDGTGHYVIFGDVWIEDWIVLGTGHERMQAVKSKGSKK
ncbi:hypothetical protein ACMFFR_00010 [Pseudomonas aeruginosa]|uniref:hypothetical protein n=1 Tax=Pseudomonas aeruginosa TaxID=287 RepID=UPI003D005654